MNDDIKQNRTVSIDNSGTMYSPAISDNFANVLAHDQVFEGVSVLNLTCVIVGVFQDICRRLVDTKHGVDVLNIESFRCVSLGLLII